MIQSEHHLTEDEITEYWSVDEDTALVQRIREHCSKCGTCYQKVEDELLDAMTIVRALDLEVAAEESPACTPQSIAAYLQEELDDAERDILEEHLVNCGPCLRRLANLAAQDDECAPDLDVRALFGKVRARQRYSAMRSNLEILKQRADGLYEDLIGQLQRTFIIPLTPFAPVFGDTKPRVLGPFGKVRFPIRFCWRSFADADGYHVRIEGVNGQFDVPGTEFVLTEEDAALEKGATFMWTLSVVADGIVVEELTGFFTLISDDEASSIFKVEDVVDKIDPPEDRYVLLGEVLERHGLYVDAIENYSASYEIDPWDGVALRIACCYDQLELEELRDEWNARIAQS